MTAPGEPPLPGVAGNLGGWGLERVRTWLDEKWGDNPCPLCKVGAWSISSLAQVPEWASLSQAIPVFPVTCTNCGNTVLISSLIVGLVPPGVHLPNLINPAPEPNQAP